MCLTSNFIIGIILAVILSDFFLNIIANYLNIKNINVILPDEFSGSISNEKYVASQVYLKTTTKFGLITSAFDICLILSFWFFKGFPFVDNYLRSFGMNPVMTGLMYIFILGFTKSVISIPFSIYSTFIIEKKFGFNKTTPKLFVVDLIKFFILNTLIGGFLVGIILAFFEYTGSYSWLICWITTTLFLIIVQYVVPTWVLPLFNKFTPLETGALRNAIFEYSQSINFALKNIFIMDGSKRSTKSNAFFAGFGKNKRIVLFDTLIQNHAINELLAILAHEMGHFKKKHILKNLIISIAHMGLIFFLLSIFISSPNLFNAFYMDDISVYGGLIFFGILYSPIEIIFSIFMQVSSRKDEFEADKFAVKTTGNVEPLINALKKLSVNNLSNLTPHPLFVFLNYSHPPVLQRIKRLESLKRTL